jgi:NAD(P)-dependent dehydrogenase (short-subunit alcohol dehydrogenase family)
MYLDTGRGDLERRKTALNRFGAKADVAHAAVYLASDMAGYVTGDNLVVDGGRWLKYVAA